MERSISGVPPINARVGSCRLGCACLLWGDTMEGHRQGERVSERASGRASIGRTPFSNRSIGDLLAIIHVPAISCTSNAMPRAKRRGFGNVESCLLLLPGAFRLGENE